MPSESPQSSDTLSGQESAIPVIGIAGGIGSGKSSVALWPNEQFKLHVIDADQVGHYVLTLQSTKQQLKETFGNSIFDSRGEIVRSQLARLVFGDSESRKSAREQLETIVHPEIRKQIEVEIDKVRKQADADAIILDAAVMLESGWFEACDRIVFVDTPFSTRLQRVTENRGWDEAELKRRESSQWPVSRKRKAADVVIDNSTGIEHAGAQFAQFLASVIN